MKFLAMSFFFFVSLMMESYSLLKNLLLSLTLVTQRPAKVMSLSSKIIHISAEVMLLKTD